MKDFIGKIICVFVLTLVSVSAQASPLEKGLFIIGFDGENWYPYVVNDAGNWEKKSDILNPAHASWHPDSGLFVKGDDQSVYLSVSDKPLKLILDARDNGFTQLRAYKNGVALVSLLEGKSQDTTVSLYDTAGEEVDTLRQASAQFHPYVHQNKIFYAHVSCRLACSPLVQDVWVKNIGGTARQLTNLNSTSYLHSVNQRGDYGFISSNRSGYYHLGILDINSQDIEWITDAKVTDSFPSISGQGDLYFLRRTVEGSGIFVINDVLKNEVRKPQEIRLPTDVKKVRYLEFAY